MPNTPAGKINTTDPDSRPLKAAGIGYVQGYNAQATVSEEQIVLAAEISVDSPDFGQLEPMVDATASELERAGVAASPQVVVADAGYWHHEQIPPHTPSQLPAPATAAHPCRRGASSASDGAAVGSRETGRSRWRAQHPRQSG